MTASPALRALACKTYLALIHHPVYDKHRRVVATSVTNLDIHDIARSTKTYGLGGYFIVHPVGAQRELVRRIVGHWQEGPGQEQNDFRRQALETIRVVASLDEAVSEIAKEQGAPPQLVGTSAKAQARAIAPAALLRTATGPLLLCFGTGWGLTEEVLDRAEHLLRPIRGLSEYNHLSVRTAAGITLDRLFGAPHDSAGEQQP